MDKKKSEVLTIIKELTSENNEQEPSSNLSDFLQNKCNVVRQAYDNLMEFNLNYSNNNAPILQYTNMLIELLEKLVEIFDEETKSSETIFIAVRDLNLLLRAVEFLISLGVRSCLSFDVPTVSSKVKNNFVKKTDEDLNEKTKKILLDKSLNCLWKLCRCQLIQANVISKFLNFLLAGCLQMAYCTDFEEYREKYRKIMREMCNLVYKPLLFREFLILQRVPGGPIWLKTCSSDYLSRFLTEPNGLIYFLRVSKEMGANFDDHKYCNVLASLIVAPPKRFAKRRGEYYCNICSQVRESFKLRRCKNLQKSDDDFGAFFVFVASKLFEVDEKSFQRYFLKELLLPFVQCTSGPENFPNSKDLTDCIETFHYFLCSGPSESNFSKVFLDFSPLIASICVDLKDSASFCRTLCKETFVCLAQTAGEGSFLEICKFWLREPRRFRFVTSSTGGVLVQEMAAEEEDFNSDEKVSNLLYLLDFLPTQLRGKFVGEMVADCLKLAARAGGHLRKIDEPSTSATSFVETEEKIGLIEENLLNFTLLAALIEKFGDFLTKDVEKLLPLCNAVLKSKCNTSEEISLELSNEILLTCFGLISLVSYSNSSSKDVSNSEIVFLLKTLSETYPNAQLREMAKSLSSSINNNSNGSSLVTVEENFESKNSWRPHRPSFEEAMVDLNDPLIPVRVHGIITVTNLIKLRDPSTVSNAEQLLNIFLENLENEDSYVFSAAVNAVVAVGELLNTAKVLDSLFKKFVDYGEKQIENRLKLGEATVRLSKVLGDVAPFYCIRIINTFLSMMKSEEETVRASSLSNVSEICNLASYKVSDCLQELIYIVKQTLTFDKSSLVRRAAIFLLRGILLGSSEKMLEIVGDEMLNVYRLLKNVYAHDEDDIVRLHAQICLETIDANVGQFCKSVPENYSKNDFFV